MLRSALSLRMDWMPIAIRFFYRSSNWITFEVCSPSQNVSFTPWEASTIFNQFHWSLMITISVKLFKIFFRIEFTWFVMIFVFKSVFFHQGIKEDDLFSFLRPLLAIRLYHLPPSNSYTPIHVRKRRSAMNCGLAYPLCLQLVLAN